MFVMHPNRPYELEDCDRGVTVEPDGGNPDGDIYFKMPGEGWKVAFGLRIVPGRRPPLGKLFLRSEHNAPIAPNELDALIEEAGHLLLARCLHVDPTKVVATFRVAKDGG